MTCTTATLLNLTIRGASDAALILGSDGSVVGRNEWASRMFGSIGDLDEPSNVSGCLVFSGGAKTWSMVASNLSVTETSCSVIIIQQDGTKLTGSARISKLPPCPCCELEYYAVYVCALETSKSKLWSDAEELRRLKLIQDTVDASFDSMFTIDEKGTILMLNDAALDLFGYEYHELMGENISIICGGDHAAKHTGYIAKYLKTGVTKIMGKKREVPARKKDGSEFPVELGIKEIKTPDGGTIFAAFIKDLSPQKEQERKIQLRECITQAAVDSSFDPMIQIDDHGIIVSVNKAAIALFGYSKEEFIGSNVSMICGDGHGPKHDEYIARYINTGQKRIIGRKRPTKAVRKDGTQFDIELGVQEVHDEATGRRYFCGYMRDMTQHKLNKARLIRHQSSVEEQFFGPGRSRNKGGTPLNRGDSDISDPGLSTCRSSESTPGGRPRRKPNRIAAHANVSM